MNNRPPNEPTSVDVSVVLPAHNEEANILPLMEQFGELSRKARFSLEVILVDDGSTDQTMPRGVEAQNAHRFLRIVTLPHRRGLTEALRAGFSVARGQVIVFYPADRQFHPADIPRMVEKLRSGYDLVTGRKIGFYNKKLVSSFYSRLSRWLFPSIKVTDLNSVKAFRRELIDVFDYRHDWHRFWVAIAAEAGYRIAEVDVTLYQRGAGRSKFGFWRIPGGVLDLLAVKFQYHTMRRPLWYFGMTGLFLLFAALVLGSVALYQRFVEGHGYRPLVYLIMSLGLAGVVFFAMGFLAEAVAGLRQQLDTLRPAPKPHVYKPGPFERGPQRLDDRERSGRREEHRDERGERRGESGHDDRHRRRSERREPSRRPERPQPQVSQPAAQPLESSPTPPANQVKSGPVAERQPPLARPAPTPASEMPDPLRRSDLAEIVHEAAPDSVPGEAKLPNEPTSTEKSPLPETRPDMYGRRKRT